MEVIDFMGVLALAPGQGWFYATRAVAFRHGTAHFEKRESSRMEIVSFSIFSNESSRKISFMSASKVPPMINDQIENKINGSNWP